MNYAPTSTIYTLHLIRDFCKSLLMSLYKRWARCFLHIFLAHYSMYEYPLFYWLIAHLPTNFVYVPHDAFPDVAAQTVNLGFILELAGAVADDFTRLEVAVNE